MHDNIDIIPAGLSDAEEIGRVVSVANRDVADLFGLTWENAPKHPSFCTTEWIRSDMDRGQVYFVHRAAGIIKGCVAFEQADATTAYLNRLAVLPDYRHGGIGAALARYILILGREKGIETVSIGIIGEHDLLRRWYLGLGFVDAGTKAFDHLPFTVGFMHYSLKVDRSHVTR